LNTYPARHSRHLPLYMGEATIAHAISPLNFSMQFLRSESEKHGGTPLLCSYLSSDRACLACSKENWKCFTRRPMRCSWAPLVITLSRSRSENVFSSRVNSHYVPASNLRNRERLPRTESLGCENYDTLFSIVLQLKDVRGILPSLMDSHMAVLATLVNEFR
jgi:hypothetical protein